MSNTNSLGMDYDELKRDYIDFMNRSAEREIELTKENEKLKKRIEEDHVAVPTFLIQDMYHDAKEENEKLKEQNHIYIQVAKSLQDEIKGLREKLDARPPAARAELEEQIRLLGEENEKLKEDIETSEDNVMNITKERDEYFGETGELEEEIEDLKSQIPDKKGKKLSQKDKTMLKEVIEGVGWDAWEAHRKLLMRLLK